MVNQGDAYKRLVAMGKWDEFFDAKEALRKELRGQGHTKKEAGQKAWAVMVDRYLGDGSQTAGVQPSVAAMAEPLDHQTLLFALEESLIIALQRRKIELPQDVIEGIRDELAREVMGLFIAGGGGNIPLPSSVAISAASDSRVCACA
jgi:hypothetical protein